jgi:outer membrane biogenesis lipoprotein LolB
MENKRLFRLVAVITLLTIFSILLAACKLPASEGPAGTEEPTAQLFLSRVRQIRKWWD